jgi:hypothetical protein
MVKEEKILKVITRDTLKEVIDDANSLGVTEVVQILERQSGEFTLIYRA